MNVAAIRVKMVVHVLISSMVIHVLVLLDLLELFARQVLINYFINSALYMDICFHIKRSELIFEPNGNTDMDVDYELALTKYFTGYSKPNTYLKLQRIIL